MSARKVTARGAIGGLFGFIGMSVVAGLLVTAGITPAVAVTGLAANDSIGVFEGLPEYLKIDSLDTRSTMYATQGGKEVPIAQFYSQNRVDDTWDQISPLLKDAAVSTEDPRFYEHGGIDLQGTLRAIVKTYILRGGEVQGGSSITQQYVKNVRVQTCEKYNVIANPSNGQTQEQAQKAMDTKYQACYATYTDQSPDRKIKEMKLAIGLEKKYSKQQILTGYLNISGFGGQVYGVEAAARYYFNTSAKDINLQQAATLIAILNNPNNLRIDKDTVQKKDGKVTFENTAANGYKATLDRRNYVLDAMLKAKAITQKQHDDAIATKIEPTITPQPSGCDAAAAIDAAFYCQTVIDEMQNDPAFGKTADDRAALLRHGGLSIYTPLNLDLQSVAQSALSNYIPAARPDIDLGGANVAMELNTGRVVQMVQNRPWGTAQSTDPTQPATHTATQVNYNVDEDLGGSTGFQTGSTYKLFTLLEWLKEGHSVNDYINAPFGPKTYKQTQFHSSCPVGQTAGDPGINPTGIWKVGNDSAGEGGRMSVMTATAESVNTAFAQMGTQLDLCKIRQNAIDLGVHLAYPYTFTTPAQPRVLGGSPSTILGVNEIAPVTMAAAYAAVANGGKYCNPIYIDKVVDGTGKSLPVPQPDCQQKLDPNIAAGAIYALQGVLKSGGTGVTANPNDGVPIMGKTGTTDDSAQNWLVTSTTKVAQATWVGNTQALYAKGCTADTVGKTAACKTPTYVPLRSKSFKPASGGGAPTGGNVKFNIAKPILQKLDQVYGGDAFPTPTGTVLQAKQVTIPANLAGKSVAEVQSILTALGFTTDDGGAQPSYYPAGTVASTNPAPGSSTSVGSDITIYTSDGSQVQVPSGLTGKTGSAAATALAAVGLVPQFIGDQDGTVTSVNPGEGTGVSPGTVVQLTMQAAAPPPPSSPPANPGGGNPGGGNSGNGPGSGGGNH